MSRNYNDYDYTAKVATLGDSYVGKSAIVLQLCDKRFGREIPTTLGTKSYYFVLFS